MCQLWVGVSGKRGCKFIDSLGNFAQTPHVRFRISPAVFIGNNGEPLPERASQFRFPVHSENLKPLQLWRKRLP
jgi:hypothetical protein